MNDEIKEILDYLKDEKWDYNPGDMTPYKVFFMEERDKLLDYITNLQQENEKLLSENITIKSIRNMVDETIYKSRIEKAVEYIKNCPEYLWANVNTKELLNILNGKGSDE